MTDTWANRASGDLDLAATESDMDLHELDDIDVLDDFDELEGLDELTSATDSDDSFTTDFDEDAEAATSLACFEGDTGTLHNDQRRVLHALMKQRYISADRHPEHWANLLANEDLIKSRLNDLYLELHVDRTYQVAFKRQAVSETGASLPTLLHEVAHTKEETIMLVALRSRFFRQRQDGESRVYVEKAALLDEVAGMRPEHATDLAFNQKKTERAVDGLRKAGVLLKTPDPDRFAISPVIEVLLPIQKLRELMTWLMTANGAEPHPDHTADPPAEGDTVDATTARHAALPAEPEMFDLLDERGQA